MNIVKHLINFYLYSNLHIGLCAACICAFSYWATTTQLDLDYVCFLFSSTVALYGIHRLVGIQKVKDSSDLQYRFEIIKQFRFHIFLYTSVATLLSILYASRLSIHQLSLLSIPILFGLLYVVPVLPNQKRVRDLPYVKIFLIAITWSILTISIPLSSFLPIDELLFLSIERFLFIFAITLPFDLRDTDIDRANEIKTFAGIIESNNLINIALGILITCALGLLLLKLYYIISAFYFVPLVMSYIVAAIIISRLSKSSHDYFYTGLLDGIMILPLLILILSKML